MSTSNNTSHIYTPEEIQQYLSQLQHQSTMAFIPALVYLCLLIVVGSVGNSLVLVVYWSKMTRTPMRIFIISMAVIDLLTNVFIIPGEIYDMFHIWNFDAPVVCRIRLYFNASFVMSSAFLLVAIAANRYKLVCRPFENQVTVNQAKLICMIIILSGHITALPYFVILGSQTITTPNPDIQTRYCQVDDGYVKTIWPTLNSALFLSLFLAAGCLVSIFYVCIGCKAWRHTKHLDLSLQTSRCSSIPVANNLSSRTFSVEERSTSSKRTQVSIESTTDGASRVINHLLESSHQIDCRNLESSGPINDKNIECSSPIDDENLECSGPINDKNLECSSPINYQSLESRHESDCPNLESSGPIFDQPLECSGQIDDQNLECSGQNDDPKQESRHQNDYRFSESSDLNDNENLECSRQNDNQNLDVASKTFGHKQENTNKNYKHRKHSGNRNVDSNLEIVDQNVNQRPAGKHKFILERRRHLGRTNRMMLTVTLVFFIGFLPFLGLNIFLSVDPVRVSALQGVSLAFYQIFTNSYLLNSAANPIVYSLLDRRFREECLKLCKR